MNKILSLILDLEIEAEKLEPSRKEALLDLIDAFEASIKTILAPDDKDGSTDDMDDSSTEDARDEAQAGREHDDRLEPVADK